MSWSPGRRKAERALEAPFEGIPAHLAQPLWDWVRAGFDTGYGLDSERLKQIGIDLRVPLPGAPHTQLDALFTHFKEDSGFGLDLVEALLERYGWDDRRAYELSALLETANSSYRVKDSWDGLEERVAAGVKEVVTAAVDAAGGSVGDHLRNAWNAAYGRDQDPAKAYSEAIKAVEAALASHVSPQNSKQTLGTMIADISQKPTKWKFAVADANASGVDTVLHMMRTLWNGQTSRHGGSTPTRLETSAEARAAVHIAAALVQFGVSGAFQLA